MRWIVATALTACLGATSLAAREDTRESGAELATEELASASAEEAEKVFPVATVESMRYVYFASFFDIDPKGLHANSFLSTPTS